MENINHLHVHSIYSVLDGLGKINDIVNRAVELKSTAVAITDHASISGMTELIKEAKIAGIKPIVGCEFYWVEDSTIMEKNEKRRHLTVWAKNWNGVLSIMKQLTIANQQYYRRPRLSWKQCLSFDNCIIGTACSFGVLSCDNYNEKIAELISAYNSDDIYCEIMPYKIMQGEADIQEVVNLRAIELARQGIKALVTADAHYINSDDDVTHEILLAIQTGTTWDNPNRWRFDEKVYMASSKEMTARFADLPYMAGFMGIVDTGISETMRLADKINIEIPRYDPSLPSPYSDEENIGVFESKIKSGWDNLIATKKDVKKYKQRLLYEIDVINRLGFVKYFLVVEDVIRWARENGIVVGPARGSSAGSLVCYLMGITQVDPIEHGLYFERFLNPERIDLPDIDVDFQDDRRDEVFGYIINKYGANRTAHINTFGALSIKSAFRDVCRVFAINNLTVNLMSKLIDDDESFDNVPVLMSFARDNKKIVEQSKKLNGVIRQQGVHACGFIVADRPVDEVSVIERRKDLSVVNWDKTQAETFGLIKIDILGLSTLTILKRTLELVKRNHGVEIELTDIPLNNEKTLEAFSRGEGVGVFQFENSGMQGLLKSVAARSFETITDTTALFRPGSLNSGQTDRYVKICRGEEYENYLCEQLRPILEPTKGVIVYQEQIMQIFNLLGGFSWAESDKMRKIIGKKLGKDEFEKHREHFVEGCFSNFIKKSIAEVIFSQMVEFAAYSFNKSHAVSYTMISFWSMYLKIYYPLEFMAASLSFSSSDRIAPLVKEARRIGLEILPPDINLSGVEYVTMPMDNAIIAPLGCIKGVGQKAVIAILKAREAGIFISYDDFVKRVERRIVNVRVQALLKRAGAFESLGEKEVDSDRREKNLAELLPMYNICPVLPRKGERLLTDVLEASLGNATLCAEANNRRFIAPKVLGKNPSIMVINNPVKNENVNLSSDGSKYLLTAIKAVGLSPTMLYYTTPLKCMFQKIIEAPKNCQTDCLKHLRREIEIVKPKLILCCSQNAVDLFAPGEKINKMTGNIIYSKEYDCYVIFSISPQYAYFQEEKSAEFLEAIEKIKNIFD